LIVHTGDKVFPVLHQHGNIVGDLAQAVHAGIEIVTCLGVFEC
jgi:hypothetical protein